VASYAGDGNYLPATQTISLNASGGPAPPVINAGGIVGAAGFTPNVAVGGIVSLFGTGFLSTTLGPTSASALPLPTTLVGVQVLVNNQPAPLFFVSSTQINIQIPYETPVGTPVPVVVSLNGTQSTPVNVTAQSYAPGVFTYQRTTSATDPVIEHADGSLVTPASPAQPGEVLVIWATGAGKLNNTPADGAGAPSAPPSTTVDAPSVTIGTAAAAVQFSGLAPGFVGLLQINVQVPTTLPSGVGAPPALPLVISFPGSAFFNATSSPVNLWVSR
jgi:uncharacterized protein (TIGR03437 family)